MFFNYLNKFFTSSNSLLSSKIQAGFIKRRKSLVFSGRVFFEGDRTDFYYRISASNWKWPVMSYRMHLNSIYWHPEKTRQYTPFTEHGTYSIVLMVTKSLWLFFLLLRKWKFTETCYTEQALNVGDPVLLVSSKFLESFIHLSRNIKCILKFVWSTYLKNITQVGNHRSSKDILKFMWLT